MEHNIPALQSSLKFLSAPNIDLDVKTYAKARKKYLQWLLKGVKEVDLYRMDTAEFENELLILERLGV